MVRDRGRWRPDPPARREPDAAPAFAGATLNRCPLPAPTPPFASKPAAQNLGTAVMSLPKIRIETVVVVTLFFRKCR